MNRVLIAAALCVLTHSGLAQDVEEPGTATARGALEAFIEAWNTADNALLRATMNFPFVSLFPGGTAVAQRPEDFSTDFAAMRQRDGWERSAFDFETLEVLAASDDKVHAAVDFHRYNRDGDLYMEGRVFYIVTRQDGHWGLQMRTSAGDGGIRDDVAKEALDGARRAVLDFFVAFNASDTEGVTRPINYPHVFFAGGNAGVAVDAAAASVRPSFERMREAQGWHMSSIDSLEASYVSPAKVHFDIVFSRWHPDGTRYLTIPALWIMTRSDDHWGIQLRSLMPPTFTE